MINNNFPNQTTKCHYCGCLILVYLERKSFRVEKYVLVLNWLCAIPWLVWKFYLDHSWKYTLIRYFFFFHISCSLQLVVLHCSHANNKAKVETVTQRPRPSRRATSLSLYLLLHCLFPFVCLDLRLMTTQSVKIL